MPVSTISTMPDSMPSLLFSKSSARLEHDRALEKVVIEMLSDHTELFKQFSDNPDFKKWLSDTIFGMTYTEAF